MIEEVYSEVTNPFCSDKNIGLLSSTKNPNLLIENFRNIHDEQYMEIIVNFMKNINFDSSSYPEVIAIIQDTLRGRALESFNEDLEFQRTKNESFRQMHLIFS